MGATRRLAEKLLSAVLRHAPDDSRDWASAMLRELDFIEGDWAALLWALGSTTAIFRRVVGDWRARLEKCKANEEERMNKTGNKAMGVGLGVVSALMLVGCAFALLRITAYLYPALGLDHAEWTHWLAVIVVPEAIFIAAAIALWRKKGPVAAGILVTAIAVALHVVIHVTMR